MPNLSWQVMLGLGILAIMFLMAMLAKLFVKAGPNEALIVYGFKGKRVRIGRGTLVYPMFESCRVLSLELMSFDVAPQQDLYTNQGVAVSVDAVAQIKVKSDEVSIFTAAEQFLTKTPAQREGLQHARQAEEVIGVEVREEDLLQVREPDRRPLQLPLRSFAAVEQEAFAATPDEQRRGTALCRRHRRGRTEEDDIEIHAAILGRWG